MPSEWLVNGATKDRQSVTPEWKPVDQPLIDGVQLKPVKHIARESGVLTELYRSDWGFEGPVDQIFQSVYYPGAISAWHAHEFTTDRLFVTAGQMKIVLYDARRDSPTCGLLNKFHLGPANPMLVVVPPRIWHGVQAVGTEMTTLMNIVDRAYCYESPDHWRIPQDSAEIPYRFVAAPPDQRAVQPVRRAA